MVFSEITAEAGAGTPRGPAPDGTQLTRIQRPSRRAVTTKPFQISNAIPSGAREVRSASPLARQDEEEQHVRFGNDLSIRAVGTWFPETSETSAQAMDEGRLDIKSAQRIGVRALPVSDVPAPRHGGTGGTYCT
ncbi:hypothetical protein GCM10020000_29660 [Streptomyces olivoverticillatus]